MEVFPYFSKNENQCDMFLISLFVTGLHLVSSSNITANSRTRTFYTGYKQHLKNILLKIYLNIQFTL